MLAIKLQRIGKKGQPSYRIVIQEKRSKLSGSFIDDLGWRNPRSKKCEINKERAQYWMKQGAQPTDTVHNLFVTNGVIDAKKRAVHGRPKKKEEQKAS